MRPRSYLQSPAAFLLALAVLATGGPLLAQNPASAVSVIPGNGATIPATVPTTVTFVASDPDGGDAINGVQLLVSNDENGSYNNACDFWVDPPSRTVWVLNDNPSDGWKQQTVTAGNQAGTGGSGSTGNT